MSYSEMLCPFSFLFQCPCFFKKCSPSSAPPQLSLGNKPLFLFFFFFFSYFSEIRFQFDFLLMPLNYIVSSSTQFLFNLFLSLVHQSCPWLRISFLSFIPILLLSMSYVHKNQSMLKCKLVTTSVAFELHVTLRTFFLK